MTIFPKYADRIHDALAPLQQNIEKVQKTAGTLNADSAPKKRIPEVRINDRPTWPSYLIRGVGTVWGALIVAGVVPFLMFVMLSRKMHLNNWLEGSLGNYINYINVPLFAYRLGHMVRGFAVGNLIIGAVMSAVTVAVLVLLKVQGAVLLGIASGFLNLIPFLGVILASLVPMMPALAQFDNLAPLVIIFVVVLTLHFISAFSDSEIHRFARQHRPCRRHSRSAFLGLALGHHGDFAGRALDRFRQAHLRLPSFAHSHLQFTG